MYGCSGQHHSRAFQLAEPCRIVRPEKGADLSHLCWPGHNESVTHVWFADSIYCHLPELQRSKAQSERKQVFKYTGVWSCAEGTASEESGKESCVIELAIEGSIKGGSITQHYLNFCENTFRAILWSFFMESHCFRTYCTHLYPSKCCFFGRVISFAVEICKVVTPWVTQLGS